MVVRTTGRHHETAANKCLVITDPDDKNFDLEAYLKKVEAES